LINAAGEDAGSDEEKTVLRTEYQATTNRMLRVAVNGFFESLNVVVQVMEELDVDVLHENGLEDLQGVQGVEQGMIGTTVGGT
jgi:EKC/KEOPS complex subunit PCC1/LAGE3